MTKEKLIYEIFRIGLWVLRAAVFLSITGVIQHSKQTFLFCHDGYTDPAIRMYQALPRRVALINNSIIIFLLPSS